MAPEQVKVEYVTKEYLKKQNENSFIQYLVTKILDGSVIVLEGGLNPVAQARLLMEVLNYINSRFFGIDMRTIDNFSKKNKITVIYPKSRDMDLRVQESAGRFSLIIHVDSFR